MIRFFSLLFIFVLSLNALSDSQTLKRANSLMKNGSKSEQFRAYNDYKNLYLRAIISENIKLRKDALKGIVLSGNQLHIDVAKYKKELSSYRYKKPIKSVSKKENSSKLQYKVPKIKKIKVSSSNKLKSIKWIEKDKLVLRFEKKLNKKDVNFFKIINSKQKNYRYVFDIHASMNKFKKIRKDNIDKIKLAQYRLNTIRLVIQDNKKVNVRFKISSNKLIITVKSSSKPKPVVKNKVFVDKKISPKRLDRNKVIVIDTGHGGKDPGAIGYRGYREKVIVLQIGTKLKNILKSRGYKVYMTRYTDKFVKLSNRTKYANRKNADIFISIHANAVPKRNANKTSGVECYFLSKSRTTRAKNVAAKENSADLSDMNFYGKQSFLNTLSSHNIVASNKLAIDLQRGMLGSLKKTYSKVKDGGVREGPFWVLVGAGMPSVLVEVGFVTNPKEARRLVDKKYQNRLAHGLADGVERYFINN